VKFSYDGFDKTGRAVADVADAPTAGEASDRLRQQGIFVTRIGPAGDAAQARGAGQAAAASAAPAARGGGGERRMVGAGKRLKNQAAFYRQLYVLVSSGTQLPQALAALERQNRPGPWRDVIAEVRTRVEEGASLSRAMEERRDWFDPIGRSLVQAGESGGKLAPMIDRLAILTRKQAHVRAAVQGAMVYPILLMVVAVGVLGVLLTFVLPRFATLFQTLGTPLPPSTQVLMDISTLLRSYWWALGGGVVAAVFGGRAWLRTPAGRRLIDLAAVTLPLIGPIARSFSTARIARLMGVQFEGHVPLLEALRLTRESMSNTLYADLVARAEEAATQGALISSAFDNTPLVTPTIAEAIKSGEQSGQMAPMLLNIADFMDEENEVVVKSLTSIIEPIILIVLGVVVGFVALSLFLPMFDLTAATGSAK